MRARLAGTVLLVALSGCGGDNGNPDTSRAEPSKRVPRATGPVGATLRTADDYTSNDRPVEERLAMTAVRLKTNIRPKLGLEPGNGNRYVAVRLKVTQRGSTPTLLTPDQFSVVDTEDQSYEPAQYSGLAEPDLVGQGGGVRLDAGETRSGFITFEVPREARLQSVRFRDAGFGPEPDTATWTIR